MERVPRFLIPYKPDWHAAEVAAPRRTDYYESDRALGHLYRAIEIEDPADFFTRNLQTTSAPLADPISVALKWRIQEQLPNYTEPDGICLEINKLFQIYVDELSYICLTHTLTSASDVRLHEEEVVVGTILAKCSQRRLRKDRMHRVRTHSQVIVHEIQREFIDDPVNASKDEIRAGLVKAWAAWDFSLRKSSNFGANSFGLIALGIIFDCLQKLDSPPDNEVRMTFFLMRPCRLITITCSCSKQPPFPTRRGVTLYDQFESDTTQSWLQTFL